MKFLSRLKKSEDSAELLISQANDLVRNKKWREACIAFETYIDKEPQSSRTRTQLIDVYLHLGMPQEALNHLSFLKDSTIDKDWLEKRESYALSQLSTPTPPELAESPPILP